jgi:hypothetical protein
MKYLLRVLFLFVLAALPCLCRGAAAGPPNQWVKVDETQTGERVSSALVFAADLGQMLLVGPVKAGPLVQAFDPVTSSWGAVTTSAPPAKAAIAPYYQAAYDPESRTLFCLSGGPVLYSLSLADKAWKAHPPAPELEDLSWHGLASDPVSRRLVVVGADKKADNLGWSRTVVYDIAAGQWSRLEVTDAQVVREHRELVAAKEAVIDLAGRTRLAWYRDPAGAGTEAERKALAAGCAALKPRPEMARFATDLESVAGSVADRKLLEALQTLHALQRQLEDLAKAQWPVPCSRRNCPLVFDSQTRVFVLFGGDHEDYLMNDTWVLDLEKKSWRRAKPTQAPSPRAGHALCALPRSGGVALYEGYAQSSSTDYGATPAGPIEPRQLWLFDPKSDRWDLVGSWPLPQKEDRATPAPLGFFDGYASERFAPPALAADAQDRLVLAAHACDRYPWRWKRPAETWTLALDPARTDAAGSQKLGSLPNQRLYRTGPFRASFCEVSVAPKETGLDRLPENQWVPLPEPPRNPCHGCRQRDWGTCVWDSDRDQVLMWGGGHCVRSASTVAHYSPVSGRLVEGFDADEPYGGNGGGGFDSSLLNRPWVSTHNYNHYAYDPKCKLLVSARGYLYDPARMDWLRMEPLSPPFVFSWGSTVVETSPHGAVAWARKKTSEQAGLWLFDRDQGWVDLAPKGSLFMPYCDSHGMVYDAKRDRMLLGGVGGAYEKISSGKFLAFDFKTRTLETIAPENAVLAMTHTARELAYVDHADCVLMGEVLTRGEAKTGRVFTRVYDCGKNKMFLLEAGPVPSGHSTGWMYDARRKLVYVFTFQGEAWALRFNPATAKLLEGLPE